MPETPHPVDVEIGKRITSLRLAQGRTQQDLARDIGVSFQQVQKYETGSNRVSGSRLYRIAAFLNAAPAEFFPDVGELPARVQSPALMLGGVPNGHELADLFIALVPKHRALVLSVARELSRPTAEAA
ncbi:MAG: helix-turn-helix domain-containing protein [Caulobacteraceae bacterium]|nr:helix-turn-helix domain-containing protein [Caulobacteraceae bacterium]